MLPRDLRQNHAKQGAAKGPSFYEYSVALADEGGGPLAWEFQGQSRSIRSGEVLRLSKAEFDAWWEKFIDPYVTMGKEGYYYRNLQSARVGTRHECVPGTRARVGARHECTGMNVLLGEYPCIPPV